MRYTICLAILLCAWPYVPTTVVGQNKEPTIDLHRLKPKAQPASSKELMSVLEMDLDLSKDFQNKMTLKEVLGLLYEKVQLQKRLEIPIRVNQQAFKDESPEAPDLYQAEIKFPPFPPHARLSDVLQFALTQAGPSATYVVRGGLIEITTRDWVVKIKDDGFGHSWIGPKVFESRALEDILNEIGDRNGASIAFDSGVTENAKKQGISLTLRSPIPADAAIRLFVKLAGLEVKESEDGDNSLYVIAAPERPTKAPPLVRLVRLDGMRLDEALNRIAAVSGKSIVLDYEALATIQAPTVTQVQIVTTVNGTFATGTSAEAMVRAIAEGCGFSVSASEGVIRVSMKQTEREEKLMTMRPASPSEYRRNLLLHQTSLAPVTLP